MHPLTPNLFELTDSELQQKHTELSSKLNSAYRLGSHDLINQIQMILDDYSYELRTRRQKQLEEVLSKSNQFANIIDIK